MGQTHGEAHYVEGYDRLAAHSVDVAEGVCGGDFAEDEGVVNYGGEEVHGGDDGEVVGHLIDGGVVAGVDADEQVGVGDGGQPAQHLRQVLRTEF